MKNSTIYMVSALLSTGVLFSSAASAYTEETLISVCRNAATDDRHGLRRDVNKMTVGTKIVSKTYSAIANGLMCNGLSVVDFAEKYGAVKTLSVLQKHYNPSRRGVVEIIDSIAKVDVAPPEEIHVAFQVAR
jgi:hypothetical protein